MCPAKECFFGIADHSKEENDIQTLKAFDLDYAYGPAVGKYNPVSRLQTQANLYNFWVVFRTHGACYKLALHLGTKIQLSISLSVQKEKNNDDRGCACDITR